MLLYYIVVILPAEYFVKQFREYRFFLLGVGTVRQTQLINNPGCKRLNIILEI